MTQTLECLFACLFHHTSCFRLFVFIILHYLFGVFPYALLNCENKLKSYIIVHYFYILTNILVNICNYTYVNLSKSQLPFKQTKYELTRVNYDKIIHFIHAVTYNICTFKVCSVFKSICYTQILDVRYYSNIYQNIKIFFFFAILVD